MQTLGMKKITILIPCYNEESSLLLLYRSLKDLMDHQMNYLWELLFVNDGSNDQSLTIIKDLRSTDGRVSYVDLSRNFGKECAMLVGLADFLSLIITCRKHLTMSGAQKFSKLLKTDKDNKD